jgi:hypothetical protein
MLAVEVGLEITLVPAVVLAVAVEEIILPVLTAEDQEVQRVPQIPVAVVAEATKAVLV